MAEAGVAPLGCLVHLGPDPDATVRRLAGGSDLLLALVSDAALHDLGLQLYRPVRVPGSAQAGVLSPHFAARRVAEVRWRRGRLHTTWAQPVAPFMDVVSVRADNPSAHRPPPRPLPRPVGRGPGPTHPGETPDPRPGPADSGRPVQGAMVTRLAQVWPAAAPRSQGDPPRRLAPADERFEASLAVWAAAGVPGTLRPGPGDPSPSDAVHGHTGPAPAAAPLAPPVTPGPPTELAPLEASASNRAARSPVPGHAALLRARAEAWRAWELAGRTAQPADDPPGGHLPPGRTDPPGRASAPAAPPRLPDMIEEWPDGHPGPGLDLDDGATFGWPGGRLPGPLRREAIQFRRRVLAAVWADCPPAAPWDRNPPEAAGPSAPEPGRRPVHLTPGPWSDAQPRDRRTH